MPLLAAGEYPAGSDPDVGGDDLVAVEAEHGVASEPQGTTARLFAEDGGA
jgi:hypothetical protein